MRQYLAAGLVDEIEIHVVPAILGRGEQLFDGPPTGLQIVEIVSSPAAAHFRYARMEEAESYG